VQDRHQVRILALQLVAQEAGKQRVIAEQAVLLVERGHQHVGTFHLFDQLAAVEATGHRVRALRRKTLQDAGLQDEVLQMLRAMRQHVFRQVGRDDRMRARKIADEAFRVLVVFQRQRRQP
jgi:hypothetical protein